MPKATIGPDENIRLRYRVPKGGLVEFEIEAGRPVKSYIIRPRGLELFDEGSRSFKYYGGFPDPRRFHSQAVQLPFEGSWYLLIVNPDRDKSVTLTYDVWY